MSLLRLGRDQEALAAFQDIETRYRGTRYFQYVLFLAGHRAAAPSGPRRARSRRSRPFLAGLAGPGAGAPGLLQKAQAELALGNPAAAVRDLEALAREHAGSRPRRGAPPSWPSPTCPREGHRGPRPGGAHAAGEPCRRARAASTGCTSPRRCGRLGRREEAVARVHGADRRGGRGGRRGLPAPVHGRAAGGRSEDSCRPDAEGGKPLRRQGLGPVGPVGPDRDRKRAPGPLAARGVLPGPGVGPAGPAFACPTPSPCTWPRSACGGESRPPRRRCWRSTWRWTRLGPTGCCCAWARSACGRRASPRPRTCSSATWQTTRRRRRPRRRPTAWPTPASGSGSWTRPPQLASRLLASQPPEPAHRGPVPPAGGRAPQARPEPGGRLAAGRNTWKSIPRT